MCGIVSAISIRRNVVPLLVEGLKRLEYRGHDVDKPRNLAKSVTVE